MRQINVKYPCVSTYEKHETWMSYHSCCSLYLLPKTTKCHGTEEIPLPPQLCCFPWTFWNSLRAAGIRLGFKLQCVKLKLHKLQKWRSLGEFVAGFGGKSQALYAVTCSMSRHPIGKVAWAAKVGHTPESQACCGLPKATGLDSKWRNYLKK